MSYIQEVDKIQGNEARAWQSIRERGDLLLDLTGSVEKAAIALWVAREHLLGRNNLQGADSEELNGLLHPDHLAYLREVRAQGMPARYQGQRERVTTRPHPRARADMGQVYVQLMKDIAKHRVLVASANHPALKHTVSSPFELVPKMLPNRSLAVHRSPAGSRPATGQRGNPQGPSSSCSSTDSRADRKADPVAEGQVPRGQSRVGEEGCGWGIPTTLG